MKGQFAVSITLIKLKWTEKLWIRSDQQCSIDSIETKLLRTMSKLPLRLSENWGTVMTRHHKALRQSALSCQIVRTWQILKFDILLSMHFLFYYFFLFSFSILIWDSWMRLNEVNMISNGRVYEWLSDNFFCMMMKSNYSRFLGTRPITACIVQLVLL